MSKRLQTIYEYLGVYPEETIDKVIESLSLEEKRLIKLRYGDDLRNPVSSKDFTFDKSKEFYRTLIPKMRRLLKREMAKLEEEEAKLAEGDKDEDPTVAEILSPADKLILESMRFPTEEEIPNVEEPVDEEPKDMEPVISEPRAEEPIKEVAQEPISNGTIQIFSPSEKAAKLLGLINNGLNNREICDELGISFKELSSLLLELKNIGMLVSRRYFSDGSIKFGQIFSMPALKSAKEFANNRTIYTDKIENELKFLVVSDLHFGNSLERKDLVDRAFNYCVKNGINIILCGGDLMDGTFSQAPQTISDLYKQVEYFINDYPHDKNVITFSVAGDHDMSIFNTVGLNIADVCENYRPDIVIAGYNNAFIDIKNDQILLYHHIDGGRQLRTDIPITLHGHSHRYVAQVINGCLSLAVPTLSNIAQPMPTALELNVSFNRGYISGATVKQIYFGAGDYVLGESRFDFGVKGSFNEVIRNTMCYKGARTLTPTNGNYR